MSAGRKCNNIKHELVDMMMPYMTTLFPILQVLSTVCTVVVVVVLKVNASIVYFEYNLIQTKVTLYMLVPVSENCFQWVNIQV